uniref:Reverse transcriptase domain-containing protein n=1 Tax=Lactuca sativa TaxID=4236 RepID=A0A9R1X4B9_LACSA|nr:hypothetical protein LSAT_V11C700343050 [Lactuca sativa]
MAMRSASQLSLFHGIQIPNNGPSISHLFYANDALFQVIGLVLALSFWLRFLDASMSLSTLKVNFHKSRVFRIGVSNNEIVNCAHILSCEATSFPFVYLGVLVIGLVLDLSSWPGFSDASMSLSPLRCSGWLQHVFKTQLEV